MDSGFHSFACFLFPKATFLIFFDEFNKQCINYNWTFGEGYFTIVQIIFHFLWDHWAHCGLFENGVLLMYTLEGVSSVANFISAYEESQ